MDGIRIAITPRMVSEWATTPCWDMRAQTSLANSSGADHTHCCLARTSITDTERHIRIRPDTYFRSYLLSRFRRDTPLQPAEKKLRLRILRLRIRVYLQAYRKSEVPSSFSR